MNSRGILTHLLLRIGLTGLLGMLLASTHGCATAPSLKQQLESLESEYQPLDRQEVRCEVELKWAAPIRSALVESTKTELTKTEPTKATASAAQTILELERQKFFWRSTPSSCQFSGFTLAQKRSSTVWPFLKQVDTALCFWLQSFYAEKPWSLKRMPLQAWKKSDKGDYLYGGSRGRSIRIRSQENLVEAVVGPQQTIRAFYSHLPSAYLPAKVQFLGKSSFGELIDIAYQQVTGGNLISGKLIAGKLIAGKLVPQSMWIRVGKSADKAKTTIGLKFSMCRVKVTRPMTSL